MNTYIVGTNKSLIHDTDFPMCLWVDDYNIVVYILNWCPHEILKESTLEEAFTIIRLELSYFLYYLVV